MSRPGRVAGETRPCQGFSSSRLTPFLRGRASGWPGPLLNGFHRPRSRKGLPRLRAGRGWWRPRGGVRVCVTTGGGAPRGKAESLSGLLFAPLLESAVSVHGGTETVCASGWPGPPSAAGTCVREKGEPARAPPGATLLCGPAAHSQLRAEQNRFLAPFIRPAVTTEAPKGKDVTTPTRQARPPVRPDSLHLGRVLSLLLPGPRV